MGSIFGQIQQTETLFLPAHRTIEPPFFLNLVYILQMRGSRNHAGTQPDVPRERKPEPEPSNPGGTEPEPEVLREREPAPLPEPEASGYTPEFEYDEPMN